MDDDTGANDLVMDATNNQILYASTYQRRRTACCMNGGGPGSGIWKSTDGGRDLDAAQGQRHPRRTARPHRRSTSTAGGRNILYALIEGPAPRRPGRAAERRRRKRRRQASGRGRRQRRSRCERHADRPLPIRRRRRDVAEGEQREPAADVLQPGADRSERSRDVVIYAGVDLHMTTDGGKTVNTARDVDDPRRRPRDLDRSGQLESRDHRQRRRRRGQLGPGEDVEVRATTCRSASSTT